MSRVLVCGGRGYRDVVFVYDYLDELNRERLITMIIQGGATGADAIARQWAIERDVSFCTYYAQWDQHGKAAGPLRNRRMILEGKPDIVVAFPGGKGTANMIHQAQCAGVEVREA